MFEDDLSQEEKEVLVKLKYELSNTDHKLKLAYITLKILNITKEFPKLVPILGAFWYSNDSFLLNTYIMSVFLGSKENTLNHNYESNCFQSKKSSALIRSNIPKIYDITKIPDLKKWNLRFCPYFSQQTTEKEADNWKYRRDKTEKKNKRKNKKPRVISLPDDNDNFSSIRHIDFDLKDDDDWPSLTEDYFNDTEIINNIDDSFFDDDNLFNNF